MITFRSLDTKSSLVGSANEIITTTSSSRSLADDVATWHSISCVICTPGEIQIFIFIFISIFLPNLHPLFLPFILLCLYSALSDLFRRFSFLFCQSTAGVTLLYLIFIFNWLNQDCGHYTLSFFYLFLLSLPLFLLSFLSSSLSFLFLFVFPFFSLPFL